MRNETWNMVRKLGMGLVLALLIGVIAQAQDVSTNSMPGVNFSKYHTYKWVPIEGAKYPNQILDAQIKASIDAQLSAKGFTKTDADNADLVIGYQVSIQQENQWNAYSTGGMRWGGGMASAQQSTINIGTMVVDIYDPSNKTLVWTGRATKTLDTNANQEKKQKNLDKAMAKLFKKFPPQ